MSNLPIPMLVVTAIVVFYLLNSIKILRDYEGAVIFRLGRSLLRAQGTENHPGLQADRPDGAHHAASAGVCGTTPGCDYS